MKCVVYVLGKDKTGIVAAVANVMAKNKANIGDISQTLLDDLFCMTMLVSLDPETAGFNEVQEQLDAVGQEMGLQITIQRQDVFDFMYSV
ncbi:MAG: ACT domain-containing protein [Eggerthellaceae bacterium]|nr:ACT domain-containing protein [Eggerthellaceae bacterium]